MAEKALIEASNEVVEVSIEDVEAEVEEDFQEGSNRVLKIFFSNSSRIATKIKSLLMETQIVTFIYSDFLRLSQWLLPSARHLENWRSLQMTVASLGEMTVTYNDWPSACHFY